MSARLVLSTLLAAAALAPPGLARGQDLNVITAVQLKDEGGSVVLSVKGSKPPNFTTFSMADPPRFVIDLSESRFDGVPEDIVVQDGLVNVVKNLSYGSDATSIARIMIAFQVDVEPPDVQTAGTTLVVRVIKPGAPAVAGGAPAAPPAAAATPAAPDAAAEAAAREQADRQAAAQAEARAAEAQAAADARAKAEAEQRMRDEIAAQARAEEQRKAQEQADARARAGAEADARAGAEADARARAEAQAREQARLEAEVAAREEAEARARDEADARRERERQAAATAVAPTPSEPAPVPPPAEPAPAEPAPARKPPAAPLAAAPPPAPAPAERLGAGAPSAQLREIGFRQMPGVSRVFVRTSVTPRFTVQDVGDNTIRVEFENTRVTRRNDTRFLDTSFFKSAVELITPSRRGSTYVVDIRLRSRVPYQQRLEGDMLALDFERPAAAASSTAPAPAPGPDAADAMPAETAPADAPPPSPEGGTPPLN